MPRSYQQFCPAARALDVIGERWSLLIVRDLLAGPRRFNELREGLPGIATNLLASRLRRLERDGVLRRTELAPPAGSLVYELTDRGRALQPVLRELASWGTPRLGAPRRTDSVDLDRLIVVGFGKVKPLRPPPELRETYELRVGKLAYTIRVADGEARVTRGSSERPDLVVTLDRKTLLAFIAGTLTREDARRTKFEGKPEVIRRYLSLLRDR
ncbi:MAG: winged helix-turn-helix transcriptional regulator [bacterium]